jgi:hypothetical protein
MGGTYLVLALALTGCGRVGFDEHSDAAVGDGLGGLDSVSSPIALTCNVKATLTAIPDPMSARMSALGGPGGIAIAWISDAQKIPVVLVAFDAPDQIRGVYMSDGTDAVESFDLVSISRGTNGTIAGVGRSATMSLVRLFDDATFTPVTAGGTGSPIAINTSRSVTPTGNATGAVYAVTGKNGTQAAVFGVDAQNALVGTPLNIGVADRSMSVLRVGTRIAVINDSNANNCECRTAPSDLSSVGTPASYATGSCEQPVGAYVPGRSDMLFVTHDFNSGQLEAQILTLAGANVALGTAVMLDDASANPRATAGSSDYWAAYSRSTLLTAAHINTSGTVAGRLPIETITDITGYDIVNTGTDTYVLWFKGGLNILRYCP